MSCSEIIGQATRDRFHATLVLHASDLPEGRGWSPHIWQILEGRSELCVSLIEAADEVDRGDIWGQRIVRLSGHELFDEINAKLFEAELDLMSYAVRWGDDTRVKQEGEGSYYRKRTPADSRLDLDKPLAQQFDLLRVCDPDRFPAFFVIRGHRYLVRITQA